MPGARELLTGERSRKQALRDSFSRQLADLTARRSKLRDEIHALKTDIEKLKMPSQLLEHQLETLRQSDGKFAIEEKHLQSDIAALDQELKTLSSQIEQLG